MRVDVSAAVPVPKAARVDRLRVSVRSVLCTIRAIPRDAKQEK